MASIKLKKELGTDKPGAVISVPWLRGKELVASGVGVYANQPEPPVVKAPEPSPVVKADEPEKPKATETRVARPAK